ncbi:MAG: substrate-binding domain-containing protein [Chloroflexota bacterium]
MTSTGCGVLGFVEATPTPDVGNVVLDRFLDRAPSRTRELSTPTPVAGTVFIPSGLPLPLTDPLNVGGDLLITGSQVLGPLTRLMYNDFVIAGYRDEIRIEEIGSTDGFQRYCSNAPLVPDGADIVMADRSISQAELELCLRNGRTPIALRVGLDAVAIVANKNIEFIRGVSKRELASILTAQRWSDVRHSWPNVEIIQIVPKPERQIFSFFASKILGSNAFSLENASLDTFREDGTEIALAISDTPYAIGFLNFKDYVNNVDRLHLLAVDGRIPDGVTVSKGTYPLSYPLLLYTDRETLEAKAEVGDFLLYYLDNVNKVAMTVGNFPLSESFFERTKIVLLTALRQDDYLALFPPTNTPLPPPTMTSVNLPTPAPVITASVTLTLTADARSSE